MSTSFDTEQALSHIRPDWLTAQQICVGLNVLTRLGGSANIPQQKFVFERLNQRRLDPTDEATYIAHLKTMPISLLHSLCGSTSEIADLWDHHRKVWEKARSELEWDGSVSPLAGAKLIATL